MKKLSTYLSGIVISAIMYSMSACVKSDFDAPPDTSGDDPNLTVTTTIAQLKALTNADSVSTSGQFKADLTIEGVVVMDDRSGDYYKNIVIQDSTGGIEIELDKNNLYNDYPVGRKIYVKVKGLYLKSYHNLPQLGYTPDGTGSVTGVPSEMIGDYVVKANYPNTITADTLSYADLMSPTTTVNKRRLNTLVVIKDVQFSDDARGVTYSESSASTSRGLMDCSNTQSKIVLRTSNYANFSTYLTPTKKGYITGIYTVYNTSPQLAIRDTTDVRFYDTPCGGNDSSGNGGSSTADTLISENFSSVTQSQPISLTGWTNFAQTGGIYFKGPSSSVSNKYAQISAYSSGQSVVKSWLVTPSINLTSYTTATMTLRTTYGYPLAETFKAYITTSFNGDPTQSTWTELPAITVSGQSNWTWKAASVSLTTYIGQTVYIAFMYDGGAPGKTGTYELDDIKVYGSH